MMGPLTLAIQLSAKVFSSRLHTLPVWFNHNQLIVDKAPIAAFDFHSFHDDVIAVGTKLGWVLTRLTSIGFSSGFGINPVDWVLAQHSPP
nr:hypothetical protein [Tanacetum cinerariifolium]